ncbi:hypothetical protein ACFC8N_42765 [Streptomyces sp. NPDC055966]|uniref:hypothetical protein n=1 Tax=Streptomyces sp. NPDC055966 TaxID=3345669 RepID=UPI0035DA5AEE
MSGQTAAVGLGFLVGGPVGAVIGGVAAPVALAAVMWRSRRAEHDEAANQNGAGTGNTSRDSSGSGRGNGSGNGGGRNNGGAGRHDSPGGGRHRSPNGHGNGNGNGGTGNHRNQKPKVKDPVADKLTRLGKDLADKFKNRDRADKAPKNGKHDGTGPNGNKVKDPKAPKDSAGKGRKWLKDRGPQPDSTKPWADRGEKPKKDKKAKDKTGKDNGRGRDAGDVTAESAPDGLPPGPHEDRIALVRGKREKEARRKAITAARKAAEQAARAGNLGDPHEVRLEVIRETNRRIDLELQYENQLLALTAAAETPRSTPVNYPAIQAAPVGTHTAGTAIARQVDFRGSEAFAILRAMADQLAHGLYSDDDADMADHIVELSGIPSMCKNLSIAVQEAARALARTAPLHPSVIKHLNNAAVAARSAGVMADNIMIVFVQAHREDIIRVLDPRIGEERWNLRNSPGTLDAAKLRAAIATAHSARLALPAGSSPAGGTSSGGSKLVPASDGSTKKLINLMKDFTRGHMVNVLSEVAGSAAGVEVVADSVTKLYRRMARTWPTEGVVDETVRATAAKVHAISDELKKAIKAAQRAHQRELRLNEKPRKNARAESKWDVAGRRPSS